MIGYKVVFNGSHGQLTSICASTQSLVVYKIGEKTYPKEVNGPLAVFTSLGSALDFVRDNLLTGYKIFECEYELSNALKLWCYYNDGGLEEIWRSQLPTGTDLANWVELLEEVEYE